MRTFPPMAVTASASLLAALLAVGAAAPLLAAETAAPPVRPPAHMVTKAKEGTGRTALVAAPSGLLAPLTGGDVVELPPLDEHVPRPDTALGYPVGSRFTHWERIAAYFDALAAASPRVKVWEYGRTYEGRPLELAAFSSPENLAHLDEIRAQRQRLAEADDLPADERDRLAKRLPAVLWLAYGVHGDEASSAEAAMVVAYALAAGQGEMAEGLEHTIVLIDPLSNPDGRERYLHGYEEREGASPNSHREAAEHFQPWPGGRQNHYVIDLNRDWAWATQLETRSRIAAYRTWEPQVYVDFHEMSSESSYFFPPPAEPVHPRIDHRVLSWLNIFGRANAEAFDRQGWVYYKEENYDLFYPGYGDSYPSLHGAIGMTYEMAGGGRGGLAVDRADGTPLTLADRVGRHVTTSLATIRTTERNAHRLVQDYVATRLRAVADAPRVFIWPADQPEASALADLLRLHGVRLEQLAQGADLVAQPLIGPKEEGAHHFPAGSYAVSTAQPLGAMVAALLDREAPMTPSFVERQRERFEQNRDGEFYDITAWSLSLAFNLRMWTAAGAEVANAHILSSIGAQRAAGGRGGATGASTAPMTGSAASGTIAKGGIEGTGELGYLVPPSGVATYRLAAALRQRHVHFRVALGPLSLDGVTYAAGTLYIPRHGNADVAPDQLTPLLREGGITAHAIASSFEVGGLSLGSNAMPSVRPLRVGLVSGEGVDATSFGFLWHLLDRDLGVPCDRLDIDRLRPAALAKLDVLILPSGSYEERIGERTRSAIDAWIKAGGELVAIGGETAHWLHNHDLSAFKPWKAPEPDAESEGSQDKAMAERDITTPGAILATRLQAQHPLAIGLPSAPPVLVEGSAVLLPSGDPHRDVLVAAPQDPVISGFAWPEAKQRLAGSLLVGCETRGAGVVILFVQEPDFRLFWRGTMPLLLNSILYGPALGLSARGQG